MDSQKLWLDTCDARGEWISFQSVRSDAPDFTIGKQRFVLGALVEDVHPMAVDTLNSLTRTDSVAKGLNGLPYPVHISVYLSQWAEVMDELTVAYIDVREKVVSEKYKFRVTLGFYPDGYMSAFDDERELYGAFTNTANMQCMDFATFEEARDFIKSFVRLRLFAELV